MQVRWPSVVVVVYLIYCLMVDMAVIHLPGNPIIKLIHGPATFSRLISSIIPRLDSDSPISLLVLFLGKLNAPLAYPIFLWILYVYLPRKSDTGTSTLRNLVYGYSINTSQ